MPVNVHKLFYARTESGSLHGNLKPDLDTEQTLRAAKNDLRKALTEGIPRWLSANLGEEAATRPRFMTQGSWSYDTCNLPCQKPPQEMDWDLGIYLPIDAWEDNEVEPRLAAAVFYRMVEEIVGPVAKENGWTLARKDTCVRVKLNGLHAHIDLPLYAAPAKEFQTITEKAAMEARTEGAVMDSLESFQAAQQWDELQHISLALRDGTWRRSDPRAVAKWFDRKLRRHPSLRRIARYLKAWRDHHWESGGPSSIVLMICAAQAMDAMQASYDNRDDLALLEVTRTLAAKLAGNIHEREIDADEQFNRLSETDRRQASERAMELHRGLRVAIRESEPHQSKNVINLLRELWGDRLPARVDWVQSESGTAQAVAKITPAIVSQPVVTRTHAG